MPSYHAKILSNVSRVLLGAAAAAAVENRTFFYVAALLLLFMLHACTHAHGCHHVVLAFLPPYHIIVYVCVHVCVCPHHKQVIGFLNLFGPFIPIAVQALRATPVLGNVLSLPIVSTLVDKLAGSSSRARRAPV